MFQIGRVPHTKPHLLADTAEIALAYGEYEQMSQTDILTIIRTASKTADELLPLDEEDIDDNEYSDDLDGSQITDREQGYVEECFRQIEFRSAAFGAAYPFDHSDETLTLKEEITPIQKIYLLLLACSRVRSFKGKGITQKLADAFEEISAACMKYLMPESSEIYMFGPNFRDKNIFPGGLQEALQVLTSRMGMRLKTGWEKNYGSSGDGKLDLVAICRLDDHAPGFHVLIGQCASMENENDWQKKRSEALLSFQSAAFDFLVEPQGVLFIPVCFRQPDGDWVNGNNVSRVITLDRLRIISLLNNESDLGGFADELMEKSTIKLAA